VNKVTVTFTGAEYFKCEGSFAKFKIPNASNKPKLCFIRDSGIHVMDDGDGKPKAYRGLLPEPTEKNVDKLI